MRNHSQTDAGPAAPPSDTELRGSGSTPAASTNQPTGMPPTAPTTTATTSNSDVVNNNPPLVPPDQNKYSRRMKKSSKAIVYQSVVW